MDGFSRDWTGTTVGASAGDATAGAAGAGDSGQRQKRRDSLLLSARMRVGVDPAIADVRIRNLSAGGLMAEHGRPVPTGTTIWLELRGIGAVTGKVAWSAEGRLGIALDKPIDPQLARKPVGGGAQTPVFAKALPRR